MGNKRKKSITERRLTSPTRRLIAFLICGVFSMAADVAIAVSLFLAKTETVYIIAPAVLAAIDLAFFLINAVSRLGIKARFGHGLISPILYVLASVVITALTAYLYIASEGIMFADVSFVFWITLKILSVSATIFSFVCISGREMGFNFLTAVLTVAFTAFSGLYVYMLGFNGFFGQWKNGEFFKYEQNTLVFEYDEDNDYYVVTGVADKRGDYVVVPAVFNNKRIGAADCSLFATGGVKTLKLESKEITDFRSIDKFSNENTDIKVIVDRSLIDGYRNKMYGEALESAGEVSGKLIACANAVLPSINENEVFVKFDYSEDDIKFSDKRFLKTWIAEKGSVFKIDDLAEDADFLQHYDRDSEYDLCWNYRNMDGRIFTVATAGVDNIDGSRIEKNVSAKVNFEKIYEVSFGEDNDTKYEIDDKIKNFKFDGTDTNHRYVIKANADKLLSEVSVRNGFNLSWYYAENDDGTKIQTNALSAVLSDKMIIYPQWEMKLPTITELKTDAENNTATYGDDVALSGKTKAPAEELSLKYEWIYEGKNVGNSTNITLDNAYPSQSGKYLYRATAYSDTSTSLTSVAEKEIYVTVNKKSISFNWTFPEDTVYNAEEKRVLCDYNAADVINDDQITFLASEESFKDAGEYAISVTLTGECRDLYEIDESSNTTFTISPCHLTVTYGETEFIYNGKLQAPEFFLTPIGDDVLSEVMDGKRRNAGEWEGTVRINNTNYVVDNPTIEYKINKKEIELTWQTERVFVYAGFARSLFVTAYDGTIPGESVLFTYEGDGTDIGMYSTVASLPEDSNYYIKEGDETCWFQIDRKPVTLSWQDEKTFVYDGTSKGISANVVGLVRGETQELVYDGNAVNAGEYEMTASIPDGANYVFDEGEDGKCGYVIGKRDVTFAADEQMKEYDKSLFDSESFSYTPINVAETDDVSEIVDISYDGNALTAVNAGIYDIKLIVNGEGKEKYDNYNVTVKDSLLTITKRKVSYTWQDEREFEYDGYEKYLSVERIERVIDGDTVEVDSYSERKINAGDYVMTATLAFNPNYELAEGEGSCEFSITKRSLLITVNDKSKIYDGAVYEYSEYDYVYDGLAITDDITDVFSVKYTGTAIDGKGKGEYVISTSLDRKEKYDNYDIQINNGTLTISARPVSLVWIEDEKIGYDGTEKKPAIEWLNVVDGDELSLIYSYCLTETGAYCEFPVNAGRYTAKVVTNNMNYDLSETVCEGEFEITPAALSISARPASKTYDGRTYTSFEYEYVGLMQSDDISEVALIRYAGEAISAKNQGSYEISLELTPMGKYSNYAITISGNTLVINRRNITLTWSSQSSYVYDGRQKSPVATASNTIIGDGSVITYSYFISSSNTESEKPVNAGEYKVKANVANDNYVFASSVIDTFTYSIKKATLTISANDKSKSYDKKTFTLFDYNVSGLASADSLDDVVELSYAGLAVSAINAGSYVIELQSVDKAKAANYEITLKSGKLTITKRRLSLAWSGGGSSVYSGKVSECKATVAYGLIDGDDVTLTYTFKDTIRNAMCSNPKDVGSYNAIAELESGDENYTLSNSVCSFTITPRLITLSWDKDDYKYTGGEIKSEASVKGVIAGEKITVVYEYYDEDGKKLSSVPKTIGTYTVKAKTISSTNYKLSGTIEHKFKISADGGVQ